MLISLILRKYKNNTNLYQDLRKSLAPESEKH